MNYENLLVYRLATTIYDATEQFCKGYMVGYNFRRTVEQMTQAARSGKQNIVEGVLEKSSESCLKLVGVARASFGELLEDYKDYLRVNHLSIWNKIDSRVLRIRAFKENVSNPTNLTNLSNWTNLCLDKPEDFANILICLIYKETYLLDKFYESLEKQFVEQGGFRENLFKKRIEYKIKTKEKIQ